MQPTTTGGPGSSMPSNRVFRLTLVRHGQTTHNRLNLLQGQSETRLTELGREQARLLRRYFARHHIRYDQVFTSDLLRAYETCSILCGTKCTTNITASQLLRERSYGSMEGVPVEKLRECAYKLGYEHEDAAQCRPYGGETIQELQLRVELFLYQHLFPIVKDGQFILVVSHASTIREFTRFLCRYAHELKPSDLVVTPNTGINSFDIQLDPTNQIAQTKLIHLHQIPHLTFDVYNRENPHPELESAFTLTKFEPIRSLNPTSLESTSYCTSEYSDPPERSMARRDRQFAVPGQDCGSGAGSCGGGDGPSGPSGFSKPSGGSSDKAVAQGTNGPQLADRR